MPSIDFLGYRVDGEGRRSTNKKIPAMKETPSSKNVEQLRSYLGSLIPNLSTILQPLHELFSKELKWACKEECEDALMRSKSELMAGKVLVPYDEKRKLVLACEASPYGICPVISHEIDCICLQNLKKSERTISK